jgi:hypothetical protein
MLRIGCAPAIAAPHHFVPRMNGARHLGRDLLENRPLSAQFLDDGPMFLQRAVK